MAFNPAPSSWIASWSEDGTDVTFPIASLDQLTAAEADGTTGDWRDVFMRLIDHTFTYYDGLATADKPGRVTISRNLIGNASGTLTYRYIVSIENDINSNAVTNE